VCHFDEGWGAGLGEMESELSVYTGTVSWQCTEYDLTGGAMKQVSSVCRKRSHALEQVELGSAYTYYKSIVGKKT
jgi:hypothetical protein